MRVSPSDHHWQEFRDDGTTNIAEGQDSMGGGPDILHPRFQDDATKQAYVNTVENATGGLYQVTADPLVNGGNVAFTRTAEGPVTQEQQAFIDLYSTVVNSPVVVNQNIVSNDVIKVGEYATGKVDITDVAEFDKAGPGGSSSAAVLMHETYEQYEKNKSGVPSTSLNVTKKAVSNHAGGITAENMVNGTYRFEDVDHYSMYNEKDGTRTKQTTTSTSNGGLIVTKTKIP
jgi:hypothetical protein